MLFIVLIKNVRASTDDCFWIKETGRIGDIFIDMLRYDFKTRELINECRNRLSKYELDGTGIYDLNIVYNTGLNST